MTEATKTPLDPGLIARVAAGVRYLVTGDAPSWFGPQQPLAPVVPETEKPSVEGRQFDYPIGFNIQTRPRTGEPISYEQMRAFADNYDLLRLVIETRKDQLAKLEWGFKPRDKKATPDSRCDELAKFFRSPDKDHDWDTWLRMLLEDLFVIDAPALYVRKTLGGDIFAFEPLDGSTIKRVLTEHGRTPLPPAAAYQQILKGVPAIDYTRDELLYLPRNVRTNKVYGYSPVEQIIMTVNIALRRQLNQLSYYTEGNTPNLVFGVPEAWNPDQIKQFQEWWDYLNFGGSKHSAKFVPGGVTPHDTKAGALKDEYDEWLARVVCYAFSVSPQPFIKEMNRATAQTGHAAALSEGLSPIMQWVKNAIDRIVSQYFGWDDIEFAWDDETPVSPTDQAVIDKTYVDAKIWHPDEVRHRQNKPPLTPEQKADMTPSPPPQFGGPEGDEVTGEEEKPGNSKPPKPEEKPEAEKVYKAKKALSPINRDRPAVVKARTAITQSITDHFKAEAPIIADQLGKLIAGVTKDAGDNLDAIMAQLSIDWGDLAIAITPSLSSVSQSGAKAGLKQVGDTSKDVLELANEPAIAYAQARAAEMVGMKWIGGELVENPKAEWAITDSTRELLRGTVQQAMEEGWSNDRLASEIADSYAFSDQRAEMIARTETADADVQGNLAAYRATNLVAGKQWIVGSETECEICQANADAGVIGLDETFPDGTDGPPAHPNCVCDVLPVLSDEPTE